MRRVVSPWRAVLAAAVLLLAAGCEDLEPTTGEAEAVTAAVHGYLDALTTAYSDLDASVLEGHATAPEIGSVQQVLRNLAASGDRVEARLLGIEVERIDIFRRVNATVRLTEVWDVIRYDAFNGREKGRNPSSVQRSILQLRLMDEHWMVTARRVLDHEGPSRWKVETPTAEPAE